MKYISAGAIAAVVLSCGAAHAQVRTPVSYTLTGSEPTLPYQFNGSNTPCPAVSAGGSRYYVEIPFTVTATGAYIPPETGGTMDGLMGVYEAPFDPLDPAARCISISDDSGSSMTLTSGVNYVMVATSFGTGVTGSTTYTFDGPGAVVVSAAPAVPALSEWALILFGGLLLAGAGWAVQRRRLA